MIDYGIQNEQSHVRAHVCPVVKRVYVYPTFRGVQAIETGRHREVPGFQKGVAEATSMGYLVPPFEIRECVALQFSERAWEAIDFKEWEDTTAKGHKAERLVKQMILRGLFPIPALCKEVTEEDLQIQGGDIYIKPNALTTDGMIVQVKCDFRGGEEELGGTGNLFLQVAESNPLGRH